MATLEIIIWVVCGILFILAMVLIIPSVIETFLILKDIKRKQRSEDIEIKKRCEVEKQFKRYRDSEWWQ